ncbi:MAG: glycosyltransferase [Methylococcales bacterium]
MIKVTIVYPADPMGVIPGGIDTCIRDIIRSAPEDFEFSLLGATTDSKERPVGSWTACDLSGRKFKFYPVYFIDNPKEQPKIPATIRHLFPLLAKRPKHEFDILQFHRLEPVLPFISSTKPKFVFIHQNMSVIEDEKSDIRWKYFPQLYFKMEDWLIPKFKSVFCVHQQGVRGYKKRYPDSSDKFRFLPTWMNPDIFYLPTYEQRLQIRQKINSRYNIDNSIKVLLSIGRIDTQKNPQRLLKSMHQLVQSSHNIHLLMIGDGTLRKEIENLIDQLGLKKHVTIVGLIPNDLVAEYLRGSDLLVLSSDYEGMPRCIVEALGCGVPVATTDVGEVKKIVKPGNNGQIAKSFSVDDFTQAVTDCLDNINSYRGKPCLDAVSEYTPMQVLAQVYQAYRDALD